MLQSPRTIELVADRIERAYVRRYPDCQGWGLDGRIWSVAASALVVEHRRHRWLPIDPELFVASQSPKAGSADPWTDLAPTGAMWRYRRRVKQIVRGLRHELRLELRRVGRSVREGESLEVLLRRRHRWLSPLGRYIAAYQAGRMDLVDRFRCRARHQHQSCPLYRLACQTLLPESAYPVLEVVPGFAATPRRGPLTHAVILN